MHIKIMANELVRALSTAMHALSSKNTLPQLDGVLVTTVGDDTIELVISNGNMLIEVTRKVKVLEEGSVLFPARLLYDLARRLDGELEIICDREKRQARVIGMGSKTDMRLMDDESFPGTPKVDADLDIRLKQRDFAKAVNGVIFAAAIENLRRILKGCLMEVNGSDVSFVCLDGFRVAIQKLQLENGIEGSKKAVLPVETIGEVARMVDSDSDETIRLRVNDRFLQISLGEDTNIFSPLLLGEYIDYKQLLPTSWTTSVKIKRHSFMGAVERSGLFARFVNNTVRMSLSPECMQLKVTGEKGNVDEKIDISFEGLNLELGFNNKYLMEALRNIDSNEMLLHFNTNLSPCLITPVKGDQYIYLILPVRLVGQA